MSDHGRSARHRDHGRGDDPQPAPRGPRGHGLEPQHRQGEAPRRRRCAGGGDGRRRGRRRRRRHHDALRHRRGGADDRAGASPRFRDGAVWVQASTVGIEGTDRLAALARDEGVDYPRRPDAGHEGARRERPARGAGLRAVVAAGEGGSRSSTPSGSRTQWVERDDRRRQQAQARRQRLDRRHGQRHRASRSRSPAGWGSTRSSSSTPSPAGRRTRRTCSSRARP